MQGDLASRSLASIAFKATNEPGFLQKLLAQLEDGGAELKQRMTAAEISAVKQLFGQNSSLRLAVSGGPDEPDNAIDLWWA